jgi:hypothetical protein
MEQISMLMMTFTQPSLFHSLQEVDAAALDMLPFGVIGMAVLKDVTSSPKRKGPCSLTNKDFGPSSIMYAITRFTPSLGTA